MADDRASETGYEAFSRIVFGPGGILSVPSGEVEYCICGHKLDQCICDTMYNDEDENGEDNERLPKT